MKKTQIIKLLFLPRNINILKKNQSLLLTNNDFYAEIKVPQNLHLQKKNNFLTLSFDSCFININSWYYSFRNILYGLNREFKIRLLLKGVGFKANVLSTGYKSKEIELKLGHSHTIKQQIKKEITLDLYKNTIINLTSPFKELLGLEAAKLHFLRKPDSYKGKGIVYKGNKLALKVGKKA